MDRSPLFALMNIAGGRGVEIGALHQPMVTRAMGPVEYVDRAPRDELLAWYATSSEVDLDQVVEVDHVWGAQRLVDCLGGRAFDYVAASHVIEHVPDLFGWLGEIAEVLVDGGIAAFAVPDKRYTFDSARRTSSSGELIDAYVRGLRRPDARQVFDCFHNFRHPVTGCDRDGNPVTETTETAAAASLLDLCRRMQVSGEYVDAHCWVFTPRSMADVLDLASRLDLLPFEIALLTGTPQGSNEFLLALRRLPDTLTRDERRAAFLASLEALDLPEEPSALEGDIGLLQAQAAGAQARVAAMEASTSWRLTAPLRAAVTAVRRLAGRA